LSEWEFGWGTGLFDLENDQDQDIVMVGSFALPPFNVVGPGVGNPGRLFRSSLAETGALAYDMAEAYGLADSYTAGLAVGDYDGDGYEDVAIARHALPGPDASISSGAPILLKNPGGTNNWINCRLTGTTTNKAAVGAVVSVETAGGVLQTKEVQAGTASFSTSTPWPTFGIATNNEATLTVNWPASGLVEVFLLVLRPHRGDIGTDLLDPRTDRCVLADVPSAPCNGLSTHRASLVRPMQQK